MAVPAPNIRWRGAHPNNFTYGRPGASRDGRNSFHHVVGSRESAVVVFNQPSRGASSHFVVGGDIIDQCVSINDTAWCDGNWESNLRTISVEHEGGWNGNGPYSPEMYENAARLCAWLRENYGVTRWVRHRDVSLKSTACPGGLDVEYIWARATDLINHYNAPVDNRPEWMKNRVEVPVKTVYAQQDNTFVNRLEPPVATPADARRFPLNQSFEIKGETTVSGIPFWITTSSFNANLPNGIAKGDVKDTPFVPPTPQPIPEPPKPTTPSWADALIANDRPNVTMYVLRATPLIDLENGHPAKKADGSEIWYQAGDIIQDVSTHTIVNEVTYQVTEYGLQQTKAGKYQNANGIKSSDLSLDPLSTPPGTPANPGVPTDPVDPPVDMPDVPTKDEEQDARLNALEKLVKIITDFLSAIFSGFKTK